MVGKDEGEKGLEFADETIAWFANREVERCRRRRIEEEDRMKQESIKKDNTKEGVKEGAKEGMGECAKEEGTGTTKRKIEVISCHD